MLGQAAIVVEFSGGLGLLFGVLTRAAALALAIHMIVGIFKVHLANGFFMNWAGTAGRGEGIEFNLVLIASLISLVLIETGRDARCDPRPS